MKMNLTASYDKVALTCAVLAAAGLASAIYVDAGKVERDFADPLLPTPVPTSVPFEPSGTTVDARSLPDGPPLFTSPPVHLAKDGTLLDLRDPGSPAVHPPIPNPWWLEHGLDPGRADAPQRDPDRDGFSNLEEFRGQTDPVDGRSHPSLIHKLRAVGLDKAELLVSFVTDNSAGQPGPDDIFGFRQEWIERNEHGQAVRRRSSRSSCKAGRGDASLIFQDGPGQLRFELVSARREQGGATVVTLVDRLPHKEGRRFEIRKGGNRGVVIRDYTATFSVDVPAHRTRLFAVAENEVFALPGEEKAGARYRFSRVVARNGGMDVVIEVEDVRDGETRRLPVPE